MKHLSSQVILREVHNQSQLGMELFQSSAQPIRIDTQELRRIKSEELSLKVCGNAKCYKPRLIEDYNPFFSLRIAGDPFSWIGRIFDQDPKGAGSPAIIFHHQNDYARRVPIKVRRMADDRPPGLYLKIRGGLNRAGNSLRLWIVGDLVTGFKGSANT